jgi:hypothetical protein
MPNMSSAHSEEIHSTALPAKLADLTQNATRAAPDSARSWGKRPTLTFDACFRSVVLETKATTEHKEFKIIQIGVVLLLCTYALKFSRFSPVTYVKKYYPQSTALVVNAINFVEVNKQMGF